MDTTTITRKVNETVDTVGTTLNDTYETVTRTISEQADGIGSTINETYANISRTIGQQAEGAESTIADTYDTVTRSFTERTDAFNDQVARQLEQLEARMPELPKKVVAYNRAVAHRAATQARRNNEMVVDAFRPVVRVADNGFRTVVGTTKWAVEQTAQTATTGARSVVGQAQAQAKRAATTLNRQTVDLVDEATDRVVEAERSYERTALRSMTKAELYEIAQDLDIEGRAGMTKAQLVTAIVQAG